MAAIRALSALFALPLLVSACLPDDTRAPPGKLVVTVSADEALSQGIASTEDGWSITYTRFLVVLGGVRLGGDGPGSDGDCDAYTESHYGRIFELTGPSPQRVMVGYALGTCRFGFRVASPSWDTLLGSGVSAADDTFLRTPGSDAHATNAGISVHIEGSARRLAVTKTFNWSFRRFIEYDECVVPSDDQTGGELAFSADQTTAVDILIRGGALFQNAPFEQEVLPRFEPYRAADDEHGNHDGDVTLEELQNSPLPEGVLTHPLIETLGDRLYLQLLPEIARFQGVGRCQVSSSEKRPDSRGP